ncbi:class I SAM-dependent methyltransferase [Candidatus Pelagibacter sp.]|nr:class I SAM-dependent methyltransferase [Candidatus Pelagibacter sp.]MDC1497458.1 class I SAM-dependent methyltransferase [Pelagibacteraceae bacterium]
MIYKKIKCCRICNSNKLSVILDLGYQALTGKFSKSLKKTIKTPLSISLCRVCKFVQLTHDFNNSYLYNSDYGYESGINSTMKNHLSNITKKIERIKKLRRSSVVIDIASNDGTLLNSYKKKIIKVGIDPILNRFKKNYNKIDYKISDFFSYQIFKKLNLGKADIITAFAVFYDIKNPNQFLKDIKDSLSKDGLFIIEQSNLAHMIRLNSFDTICQEHLGYYSTSVIKSIMEKNKLKIIDHQYNQSNGGSSRYYITHIDNQNIRVNTKNINYALKYESKFQLDKVSTYSKFKKNINIIKKNCTKKINSILSSGKKIHGYGASTKGNVILQYLDLNNKKIKFIADRNPFKYNKYTPGTSIKIISEKNSRAMKPDYYFVLPWHFRKEILKREIKIRKQKTKFIFPLPKFEII